MVSRNLTVFSALAGISNFAIAFMGAVVRAVMDTVLAVALALTTRRKTEPKDDGGGVATSCNGERCNVPTISGCVEGPTCELQMAAAVAAVC